jgi:sarcosine oxidase delta subunit
MVICGICDENETSKRTRCLGNHEVCESCYGKILECPYCRYGYILSTGCEHENGHNNEVSISEKEYADYMMFGDGELGQSIRDWVYIRGCNDEEGMSALYAECLEKAVVEFYHIFEDEVDKDEEVNSYLPIGIKIYLSYLNNERKKEWYSKLRICYINVVLRLLKGKHIDYLISGESELCECVGEEFMLWTITHMANEFYDDRVTNIDEKLSVIDKNRCILFLDGTFFCEQDKGFLYFDNEIAFKYEKESIREVSRDLYKGNISPCDWFVKY